MTSLSEKVPWQKLVSTKDGESLWGSAVKHS